MIASNLIAIVALALGVAAAPTAGSGSFKLSVLTQKGVTLYLNDEGFSADKSKALDCALEKTSIFCGPEKKGIAWDYSAHTESVIKPTVEAAKSVTNSGFVIGTDNTITWTGENFMKTPFEVKFSTRNSFPDTVIFAEPCSGNGHADGNGKDDKMARAFRPGVAKAVFNN